MTYTIRDGDLQLNGVTILDIHKSTDCMGRLEMDILAQFVQKRNDEIDLTEEVITVEMVEKALNVHVTSDNDGEDIPLDMAIEFIIDSGK